jgi:hypothetical protein
VKWSRASSIAWHAFGVPHMEPMHVGPHRLEAVNSIGKHVQSGPSPEALHV